MKFSRNSPDQSCCLFLLCELVVPDVERLQPVVVEQPVTEVREAVLVQPDTVPLQRETGQGVVLPQEPAQQRDAGAGHVVTAQQQHADGAVGTQTLNMD